MQGQTALHHALSTQRTRAVPILLMTGADLTQLNVNFFSPLHDAAGFGFLPYVTSHMCSSPSYMCFGANEKCTLLKSS